MELVPAQKQKVWKLPAIVNFSCGGMGTGLYLLGLFVAPPQDINWLQAVMQGRNDWLLSFILASALKLLGPALVGLGFLALTIEAGRPRRGLNLFRHLRRSWMSRETLAAALFIPLAGLDWLWPDPALRALAALAAFALMLCQGFIVYRARGVTAWNTPLMPLLFATSGLATGSGLTLVVLTLLKLWFEQNIRPAGSLVWIALMVGVLNLGTWLIYTWTPDRAFRQATTALRHPNALALIVGAGHLLPAMLLSLALIGIPSSALQSVTLILSGLAFIFGGIRQKYAIVLESGYLRTIELPIRRRPVVIEQRT